MSEGNRKTPRTFQCRNSLYEVFQEMGQELECSFDYLINDAMKQYARQRGYLREGRGGAPAPAATAGALAGAAAPPPPPARAGAAPNARPPARTATTAAAPPPRHQAPAGAAAAPPAPAPPLPAVNPSAPAIRGGSFPAPPSPPVATVSHQPTTSAHHTAPLPAHQLPPMAPPAPSAAPRPMAPTPVIQAPPAAVARPLQLVYDGQSYPVTKDKFVIGRGKSSSDLTIRDPNISRQHAMIELSGAEYYMVDMGSTNGVEYSGQRVQRRAIVNGDVFKICNHEIHCVLG
ncbi:MAG: FHA domain-containing protein [Polyangiaceae bacterium]|nr:FHA domain-containing protein [Polyangiaceae bacterium]